MRTLALAALLICMATAGCGAPQPRVNIDVLGPRYGASALHIWYELNGTNLETQSADLGTEHFAVEFTPGTRGDFIVVINADDEAFCTHWRGIGSATIISDDSSSLSIVLAQINPPACPKQ